MCISAEVSLGAYIIGMCGSVLLWKRGYKAEAMFYAWVVQMQLLEFIFWTNGCGRVNKIATRVGVIINNLEPIILWLGILLYGPVTKLPKWVNITMIMFGIATIMYHRSIGKRGKEKECTQVTEESKPHLYWAWNEGEYANEYYLFFIVCLVILSLTGLGENGNIHAIGVLTTFIVSKIVYGKSHSVGAIWCLMAAGVPILLLELYK